MSVAHIPEHYSIGSTGITKTKHPEVLGRYSLMATSHQNVTSIIYKQDNGSFYLLNNTRGLVVGNESMSVLRTGNHKKDTYVESYRMGMVYKHLWHVRIGDTWIYDDRLEITVSGSEWHVNWTFMYNETSLFRLRVGRVELDWYVQQRLRGWCQESHQTNNIRWWGMQFGGQESGVLAPGALQWPSLPLEHCCLDHDMSRPGDPAIGACCCCLCLQEKSSPRWNSIEDISNWQHVLMTIAELME